MLNWADFSRLLMIFIGALSGFGSARDMKVGILATILFTIGGLVLGFGMSWVSFNFERRFLFRGKHPFVYFFIPFVWIFAAWLAPVCLALIVYGHK